MLGKALVVHRVSKGFQSSFLGLLKSFLGLGPNNGVMSSDAGFDNAGSIDPDLDRDNHDQSRDESHHNYRPVVDDVSFELDRGEIFGVLGQNGSGKSTLIRMISTLLIPDRGFIRVFDDDVTEFPMKIRRVMNRVSVEASFFKQLSAMENLLYSARLYGLSRSVAIQRINEILTALGFDLSRTSEPMETFSRGMQQKIAITRALMTEPGLLLLDEPTTGLDPKSRLEVENFVRKVRSELGTTILLTTHDMKEAEALCDRAAILNRGKIVAMGTFDDIRRTASGHEGSGITLEEAFLALAGEPVSEEHSDDD